MFNHIEGGSVIEVNDNAFGFIFKCNVPPIGYGQNIITGAIEKTDVLKRSEIPEEQYYERVVLAEDYKKKRKREEERQEFDPFWVDKELEKFRVEDWNRRLCGVWFWNYNPIKKESEPIYITGLHYFYINWWKFDGKFNNFRMTDRDFFYVCCYCMNDPCCLGVNEIAKRKQGKTARAGCVLYERASRSSNHHAGIQSKTDDDAEEVFKKAVVHPWRSLPHFYRPVYDLMKGDNPGEELRFFNTTRRGQKAEGERQEEALDSYIDFKSRNVDGYDGPLLLTYLSDESGKLKKDVSIIERQKRVRFSREDVGNYLDTFHLSTTTVEIEEDSKDEDYNDEFQELTIKSNPLERDKNGHTGTGLYTYFTPAYKSMYFDKYGFPNEEMAKIYFINTRQKLEEDGDFRGLSSFKRKNPFTLKEAFSVDGQMSIYNPELLNAQLDMVSWRNDLVERGNLEWVNGFRLLMEIDQNGTLIERPSKVKWVPNPNGRWTKVKDWMPKEQNKVSYINGKFIPNNNFAIRIGCDPFKFDKTKDKRRSDCVAYAYQVKDDIYPSEFDDMFVLEYAFRTETTRESNEDILKMAWWLGCKVLFERNVNHWKQYFQDSNCIGFLMYLPGEQEPGIYADGKGTVVQAICNHTSSYINDHIGKCFFKKLMQKDGGWLGFKVEDTQKYDRPMAAGYTLISVKGMKKIKTSSENRNIDNILPPRKAN